MNPPQHQVEILISLICLLVNAHNIFEILLTSFYNHTEDFQKGIQVPPIIKQLKTILETYPDNGQILKVKTNYRILHTWCNMMDKRKNVQ